MNREILYFKGWLSEKYRFSQRSQIVMKFLGRFNLNLHLFAEMKFDNKQ